MHNGFAVGGAKTLLTSLLISFIIAAYKRDGGEEKPEMKKKY